MVKPGLMSGEEPGSPCGCTPPASRVGTPGSSAPPGPQRVKSGRACRGADVFGLCSWERKRLSEASALLVLRRKQEKTENCSVPGAPGPARGQKQPLERVR